MCGMKYFSNWEKWIYFSAVVVRLFLLFLIIFNFEEALYKFPGSLGGSYIDFSKSMLAGDGFSASLGGYFESKRTPGYSVYLLPFVGLNLPLWMASVFQIVLVSLLPIIAMRFVRKIGFGVKNERLAGLFTAFEPLQIFYSVLLMPDALTALLFFAGAYGVISFWIDGKYSMLISAAILFALSNYLRPMTLHWFILVPLLLILAWGVWRKQWSGGIRPGLIFGAIFFLLVLPWMARNYYHFGVFGFSSGLGPYVLIYSGSGIIAATEHVTFEEAYERIESEVTPLLPYPQDFYSIKNSEVLTAKAKEIVWQYREAFLKMYFFAAQTYFTSGNYHFILKHFGLLEQPSHGQVSITRLFASDGVFAVWYRLKVFVAEPYGFTALVSRLFLGTVFLSSLYGVYLALRQNVSSRFAALMYLLAIAYGALSVVAGVEGMEARHRLWLNPLIFVFAAVGIVFLMKAAQERWMGQKLE
jgi:hypothetical protein